MSALSALVRDLDAELRRLGYKDATMVWYRGCWRRMQNHFDALGIEEFSLDAAMAWADQACGFFAKEQGHPEAERHLSVQGRCDARRVPGTRGGAAAL